MDYIYGSLNEDVEQVEYYGVNTDTANTTIEQEDRTIKVDVKKVPNTLTITNGNSEVVYDGSSAQTINIDSGSDYSAGEGITISDNTISIDSETVATKNDLTSKQDTLESGVTIKTINNESILGSGDLTVSAGTTLNQYTYTMTNNTSGRSKVGSIIYNAKGNVQGYIQVVADGMQLPLPISCIQTMYTSLYRFKGVAIASSDLQNQKTYIIQGQCSNGEINYGNWTSIAQDGTIATGTSLALTSGEIRYWNDTQLH